MHRLATRTLFPLISLALAVSPSALAQTSHVPPVIRSGSPSSMPGTRSFPPGGNFSGFRRFHDRDRRPVPFPFFPFGLFADSLFPDGTGPQESSAPPSAGSSADLMQALSALGKASAPIPPPSEPLLIELQGDRYVRLSIGEARENPA